MSLQIKISILQKKHKEMEWAKAQEITFSTDLVAATKKHLQFLAAVDSTGCLYQGPALERAIYRYKNCWLPLLAKHMNCPIIDGPLVVPLDCEWIWHCHRLNPVQYNRDCEKIYEKILGNLNVMSTVEGACPMQTKSLWERIYVTEPYNLDLSNVETLETNDGAVDEKGITIEYDLVDAVKRQSSFFSKVSKMMNSGDGFIEEAVARYKAFNHLIKKIDTMQLKPFCVPTVDIDLIWHSHQLYPLAYYNDMKLMHGKVIDHNDRDSGSLEGKKKMDLSFVRTKTLWEVMFGNSYSITKSQRSVRFCQKECFHTCVWKDSEDCAGECYYECLASEASEDAAICSRECLRTCLASKASEDAAVCARECFHTCVTKASEDVAV